MNARSLMTFFTYMLRQKVIPFWKELFITFHTETHYISRVTDPYIKDIPVYCYNSNMWTSLLCSVQPYKIGPLICFIRPRGQVSEPNLLHFDKKNGLTYLLFSYLLM